MGLLFGLFICYFLVLYVLPLSLSLSLSLSVCVCVCVCVCVTEFCLALIGPVVLDENFEMIKDDNNNNGYNGQQIMGIGLSHLSMLFAALYFRGFLFAK